MLTDGMLLQSCHFAIQSADGSLQVLTVEIHYTSGSKTHGTGEQ
jgi:hypothetical protein